MILQPLSLYAMLLAAPAPLPDTQPTSDELREAARDLDDDQYRVRTTAAKKLRGAGKKALVPLVFVAETGSVESADRAVKIIVELSFDADAETMSVARVTLHKLAARETKSGEQAREALLRFRKQIMNRLEAAGARFQFDGEKVRAVYLDGVTDLSKALPYLREIPQLEEVSVSNKKFDDTGMVHLLPLKNLKWLNLWDSDISDESLKSFKNFPKLESVPMGRTRVTDAGLAHIAELTQLEYVGLRGNDITDAGLVHLKKLSNLTSLTLQETKVTDAGLEHLKGLTKLEHVRLQKTAVTNAGIQKLRPLKALRHLDVSNTAVTAEGAERLKKAIPELNVALTEW
jgi:hypothetical protein